VFISLLYVNLSNIVNMDDPYRYFLNYSCN